MRASPVLLAPQAVTVALVGWLLWSLLGTPTPPTPPPKLLQIDAAQLTPRFGPLPARDPFRTLGEATSVAPVVVAAPKPDAAPTPPAERPDPAPVPRSSPTPPTAVVGTADGSKEQPPAPPAPRLPDPRDGWRALVASLDVWAKRSREFQAEVAGRVRLSATMARAGTRRAILNDRTVAEGEAIPGLEAKGGNPIVVEQIRATSVVLRCQGTFAVVSFPSVAKASLGASASAGVKAAGGARP